MAPLLALASLVLTFLTLHAPFANAAYIPAGAVCQDYKTSITVTTEVLEYVAPKWINNYELAGFLSAGGTRSNAGFPAPVTGPVNFTGSMTIAGTFCTPKKAIQGHEKTVLLATHGIGFDRSYWNIAYDPEEYNFAQTAIAAGYSIFFYDRLGVGSSTLISGFVNQGLIQANILGQLSSMVRAGTLTGALGKPTSVVLVGHSFGSYITNALLGVDPSAADAFVATGLAYANVASEFNLVLEALQPRIASTQNAAWSNRDAGYLTWVDMYANVVNFFHAPQYTVPTVMFADETKEPFAIMELISLAVLNYSAPAFTGPVLYLDGEFDYITCAGFCPGVIDVGKTKFPNAKVFESYSQPNTGHGINFHTNATGAYKVALDFLERNGF